MATLGNNFHETIGLVTAGTEMLPSQASKVAKGLRSIGLEVAKYAQSNKDLSEYTGDTSVALVDQDGALRSTYDIMNDLYPTWIKMNEAEKASLGLALAGKTQYEVFSATMDNFSNAQKATVTAMISANSAMIENAKYAKSLEFRVTKLSATWENTINDLISEETIGGLLDLATSILKIAGNAEVLAPVLGTVAGAMVAFNGAVIGNKLSAMGSTIISAIGLLKQLGKQTVLTAGELKLLNSITSVGTVGAIGAVVAVIGLAVTAYQVYNKAQEEARKEAVELTKTNSDLVKGMGTLEDSWDKMIDLHEDGIDVTEQLKSFKESLIEVYGFEKDAVDKLNLSRQEGIDLLKEETFASIALKAAEIQPGYEKALTDIKGKSPYVVTYDSSEISQDLAKEYGLNKWGEDGGVGLGAEYDLIEAYEIMENAIVKLSEKKALYGELTDGEQELYNGLIRETGALNEEYTDQKAIITEGSYIKAREAIAQKQLAGVVVDSQEAYDALESSLIKSADGNKHLEEAMSLAMGAVFPKYSKSVKETAGSTDESTDSAEELALTMAYLGKEADNLSAQLSASEKAMSDFAEYGNLTSSTLTNLESTFPGVINGLYNTDGSMSQAGITALTTAGSVEKLVEALEILAKIGELETSIDQTIRTRSDRFIEATTKKITNLRGELDELLASDEYKYTPSDTTPPPTTKDEPDPLEEQSEKYKATIDYLEFKKEASEREAKDEEELREISLEHNAKILKELQAQEAWFRAQDLDDNSEYIQDLIEQQWSYADEISDIHDEIQADIDKHNEEILEEQKEALQKQIDDLEKNKSDMETAFSYLESIVNKQIELAQDEMDAIDEAYQLKIDALNSENDAIEKQIALEEKLEALAKAKSIKKLVYKDGQFQYSQDYDAISEAQTDLDNYNREQSLADQVTELEANRDAEIEVLQDKIDGWQEYLDSYAGIVDNYELEQDRLIAEQVLGTQLEQENWDIRLSQAQSFAEQYNAIMSSITGTNSELDALMAGDAGGSSSSPYGSLPTMSEADKIFEEIQKNTDAMKYADADTKQWLASENASLVDKYYGTIASGADVKSGGSAYSSLSKPSSYSSASIPSSTSYTNTNTGNTTNNNTNVNINVASTDEAIAVYDGLPTAASAQMTTRS